MTVDLPKISETVEFCSVVEEGAVVKKGLKGAWEIDDCIRVESNAVSCRADMLCILSRLQFVAV